MNFWKAYWIIWGFEKKVYSKWKLCNKWILNENVAFSTHAYEPI